LEVFIYSGGGSAVKERWSLNPQDRSGHPESRILQLVLNDLTDSYCTYCTGSVMECYEVN